VRDRDTLKVILGTIAWAMGTAWLAYSALWRPGLSDWNRGGFAGAALVFGLILALWVVSILFTLLGGRRGL
jgi:hypothetical protein